MSQCYSIPNKVVDGKTTLPLLLLLFIKLPISHFWVVALLFFLQAHFLSTLQQLDLFSTPYNPHLNSHLFAELSLMLSTPGPRYLPIWALKRRSCRNRKGGNTIQLTKTGGVRNPKWRRQFQICSASSP